MTGLYSIYCFWYYMMFKDKKYHFWYDIGFFLQINYQFLIWYDNVATQNINFDMIWYNNKFLGECQPTFNPLSFPMANLSCWLTCCSVELQDLWEQFIGIWSSVKSRVLKNITTYTGIKLWLHKLKGVAQW